MFYCCDKIEEQNRKSRPRKKTIAEHEDWFFLKTHVHISVSSDDLFLSTKIWVPVIRCSKRLGEPLRALKGTLALINHR